jgi:hypothetical protein
VVDAAVRTPGALDIEVDTGGDGLSYTPAPLKELFSRKI